jgi:hypothetical protein
MEKLIRCSLRFIIFALLMLSASAAVAQRHPDFSGQWSLDINSSKDLPWVHLGAYTMTVTQNNSAGTLNVKTHIRLAPGPPPAPENRKFPPNPLRDTTYTMDGAEQTVASPQAPTPTSVVQSAKWVGDNLELHSRTAPSNEDARRGWTVTDVWELSSDGRLIVHQTLEWARGKQYATLVFKKS